MRILVLSNFYPPHTIGGMEHRCRETVEQLRERGHEIVVLTSTYGVREPGVTSEQIYRLLALESDLLNYRPLHFFTTRRRQEKMNLAHLRRHLEIFDPEIVFVWGMWNLSLMLPDYLERSWPGKIVYSLANDWPALPSRHVAYWQDPAQRGIRKPLKKLAARIALFVLERERKGPELGFQRAICASRALRDQLLSAGVPLKHTRVIYPGVHVAQFGSRQGEREHGANNGRLSLLYAGSLVPHKGVHTALEAVSFLIGNGSTPDLNLTIVGSGHPDYEECLRRTVIERHLQPYVQFVPQVSRDQMPKLLRRFDVLLFPSIWEEPFARIVLEAMAAGLVVVGTQTGGTKEILSEGETGLTFATGDAQMLAAQVERLRQDPGLCLQLARNGRELVAGRFDIGHMIDEMEAYLQETLSAVPTTVSRLKCSSK
jgi:glycogen synthase